MLVILDGWGKISQPNPTSFFVELSHLEPGIVLMKLRFGISGRFWRLLFSIYLITIDFDLFSIPANRRNVERRLFLIFVLIRSSYMVAANLAVPAIQGQNFKI